MSSGAKLIAARIRPGSQAMESEPASRRCHTIETAKVGDGKGSGLVASAAALAQKCANRAGRVAIAGAAFSIIGIAMNCAVFATTRRRRPRSSNTSSTKLVISPRSEGCPHAAKASIGTGTESCNRFRGRLHGRANLRSAARSVLAVGLSLCRQNLW